MPARRAPLAAVEADPVRLERPGAGVPPAGLEDEDARGAAAADRGSTSGDARDAAHRCRTASPSGRTPTCSATKWGSASPGSAGSGGAPARRPASWTCTSTICAVSSPAGCSSHGAELHDVRDFLGHANITTTSRYLRSTPLRLARALSLLEAAESRLFPTRFPHQPDPQPEGGSTESVEPLDSEEDGVGEPARKSNVQPTDCGDLLLAGPRVRGRKSIEAKEISGEPGGSRTLNQQIKSLLLCQLSYRPTRGGDPRASGPAASVVAQRGAP